MQLHRDGQTVKYFSRNAHDHGDKSDYGVLNEMVYKQLRCKQAILDGELVVWNRAGCASTLLVMQFYHIPTVPSPL